MARRRVMAIAAIVVTTTPVNRVRFGDFKHLLG